jgi:hypothetical protein
MKISIPCQFAVLAVFGVTGHVSGGDDESQYFLRKARQHYERRPDPRET